MSLLDEKRKALMVHKGERSKLFVWSLDIIIFITIVILFISYFATRNNGYKDKQYFLNDNLVKKVIYSMINDENISLNEDEFNAILNNIILKKVSLPNEIKNISAVPKEDGSCVIFIPFKYKEVDLEYSIKSNITLNKNEKMIELRVLETKLGALPIPKDIFLKHINNESIQYKDETIFIKSSTIIEFLNQKIECGLDEFTVKNKNFYCKFKTDIDDLKRLFVKKIDTFFSNLIKTR